MYTKEKMEELVASVIHDNEPFLNEYELQFALAMAIKDDNIQNKNFKVKIEQNVYPDNEQENCRCDIVAYKDEQKVLFIELKYVFTMGKQSDKTSENARNSFISDIRRLKDIDNIESYCIFVTNKTAVYDNKNNKCYFNTKYSNKDDWKSEKFITSSSWSDNHKDNEKPIAHYRVIEPKIEELCSC